MNVSRALAVLLLVSFPAAGFAAGEAEHAAGGGGLDFLWKVINFAVLFGALFYFLRKPLQAMLDKKAETVRDLLADARREREEAEAKLTEAATRVAELQDEAARLKERAAAGPGPRRSGSGISPRGKRSGSGRWPPRKWPSGFRPASASSRNTRPSWPPAWPRNGSKNG